MTGFPHSAGEAARIGRGHGQLLDGLHLLSYVSVCFYCCNKSGCVTVKYLFTHRARVTPRGVNRHVQWQRWKTSWRWEQAVSDPSHRACQQAAAHDFPRTWNTWLFGRATTQKWTLKEMLAEKEKPYWLCSWSWNPQNSMLAFAVPPPESGFLPEPCGPLLYFTQFCGHTWGPRSFHHVSWISYCPPALALSPILLFVPHSIYWQVTLQMSPHDFIAIQSCNTKDRNIFWAMCHCMISSLCKHHRVHLLKLKGRTSYTPKLYGV